MRSATADDRDGAAEAGERASASLSLTEGPLAAAWARLAGGRDRGPAIEGGERRLLLEAALVDSETGLPNRSALEQAVMRMAAGAADPRPLFVAAYGVDRFSRMRGAIGYELAAALMKSLGEQLRELNPDGEVARISPDVVALAFQADALQPACVRAETSRRALETVQRLGEHLVDVRVRGGLGAGGPPAALVREADLALDFARTENRRAAVFDPAAHASAAQSLSLMPELRQAIAENRLHLAHQPKFDLRRSTFAGVESLVRWNHPRFGPLAPDLFVTMAEETGDIRALTEWVLARAVAEQAALAAAGHHLPFSVNLSGRLVGDAAAMDAVLAAAANAEGPLMLEITETAVISDPEVALASLQRIADAGIGVSIDDYGAGLSSLSYLKRIRAQELKLDKSLLADVARSGRDALLVRSTIDLAHGLGMKVVAEGVEDDVSLALLAGMGCDVVQGWLISKAMPFDQLRDFLNVRSPPSAAEPERTRRTA